MKLKNSDIFTRPVLKEISEDFNTSFQADFAIETYTNSLELHYKFMLDSIVFKKYCSNKEIVIGLHIYSQKILYRKFIQINIENFSGKIELSRDEIFDKLEISPLLIANTDFSMNVPSELVQADENNYHVKRGMILGYVETIEIEVDYSKTNLNDLVVIKPTKEKEQSNSIDIGENGVVYHLENEEYNSYNELYMSSNPYTQRLVKIVHNAINTRILSFIIEMREKEELDVIRDYPIIEYMEQKFDQLFPTINLFELELDEVNKYAIELSAISFVNISSEGEENE